MKNALTVDLEDWRGIVHQMLTGEMIPVSPDVVEETEILLSTLNSRGARATFFVLGNVAQAFGDLIVRIDAAGHEIACHGLLHTAVREQLRSEFREETRRAKRILEDTVGKEVVGYRAPNSIDEGCWWILDTLAEEGFAYDSSVRLKKFSWRGGAGLPMAPHVIRTDSGRCLTELPISSVPWLGGLWAMGGGNLHFVPYDATARAIGRSNRLGYPAILYVHPYDVSPRLLRVDVRNWSPRRAATYLMHWCAHNPGRNRVRKSVTQLVESFQFVPLIELAEELGHSLNRTTAAEPRKTRQA